MLFLVLKQRQPHWFGTVFYSAPAMVVYGSITICLPTGLVSCICAHWAATHWISCAHTLKTHLGYEQSACFRNTCWSGLQISTSGVLSLRHAAQNQKKTKSHRRKISRFWTRGLKALLIVLMQKPFSTD